MDQKKKILIVDEELSYRELLKEALGSSYRVIDTGSCSEAAHLAVLNEPDLIIIDIETSISNGMALCENLKEDPETRDIPVILITSLAQKHDIISGLKAGASDYIVKPLCLPEVLARIESHIRTQEDYSALEQKDLLLLLELSETISVTRSPNAILRLIVNKLWKHMDIARCSIMNVTEGRKIVVKASTVLQHSAEISLEISKYPEIRKAIETKQSVIVNDVVNDPLMSAVRPHMVRLGFNSLMVIPLIKKESVIGTFFMQIISREKAWIGERVLNMSQLVANIAANALENAMLFESVKTAQEHFEEVSIRDDLTKLFNRRHFYSRLQEEFSLAARHQQPLSLLLIDVDDFKQINDTYGHAGGDQALLSFAQLLKSSARESDVPARCGGDEFAMLLPCTAAAGAAELGERISRMVQALAIEALGEKRLSLSIGCATFADRNVDSFDALVKLADDAMYRSKAQGKGRVVQA